jgi:hypothetical protein
MAVVTPSKIFVDPKEEITFIIERVLASEKDKVIIVIPQNSLLLSSIISLKILARRLAKSPKLAILVTEDVYGHEIAEKVGLIVVDHVSEVTADLWNEAENKKLEELTRIENKKNILVNKRTPEKIKNENELITKGEGVTKNKKAQYFSDIPSNESKPLDKKEDSIDHIEAGSGLDGETDEMLDKELKRYKKPRLEAKEIEIEGVKILAGGDVIQLQNLEENGKMEELIKKNMVEVDAEGKEDKPSLGKQLPISESSMYTGRDFTKKIAKRRELAGFLSKLFVLKPKREDVLGVVNPEENLRRKRRMMMAFLVSVLSLLVLVSGIWYYVTNVFSSVDIEIVYAKEDIKFSETIIASDSIDEIDPENLQIPALLLSEEDLNSQVSATATGEGIRGEKARGYLSFYNIDIETPVVIPKGTKITNVVNDLVFILQEDVNLDPVTYDDLGAVEVPEPVDGLVEAEQVGEQYNFDDDDPSTFIAQGFDKDSIQVKRLLDFEGGRSETFTAVSEKDVEAIKDQVRDKLLEEGSTKIKAFLPKGYRLLEETITFEEIEVRPFPDIGEEAKDGQFSLNMRGKVTALAVKEKDLEDITKQVLATQHETEEIPFFEDYKVNIKDVVRDENRVSFVIDSEGLFSNQLDDEEILSLIGGKKIEEAIRLVSDLEEVEDVTITYSPGFIPKSFQRVPKDFGRISIRAL